ncbi:hypothetical protein AB1Y20_000075 [Prymnesium parvum]|uniref:Phospholipase B-like n=1 Tax=Prymnesium parvum TaxID=97485 RepID=A0AB34K4U9_PRYPA
MSRRYQRKYGHLRVADILNEGTAWKQRELTAADFDVRRLCCKGDRPFGVPSHRSPESAARIIYRPLDTSPPMRPHPSGTWIGKDTSPILGAYLRTWHGTPGTYQEVLDRQVGVQFAPLGAARRRPLEPRPHWTRPVRPATASHRSTTTSYRLATELRALRPQSGRK